MMQLITPNPDIPCKPGWCLAYVNEAFGTPKVYGTATAAWNNSPSQHRDTDFPDGCWIPIWFSLATEPAGHVALRAPDGSIYSTTSPYGTKPTHHPNLSDLLQAYSRYNPLTYLGWTEDVEGTPVVAASSLSYESITITPLEDDDMFTDADRALLQAALNKADGGQLRADLAYQNETLFSKADGAWQNGILADISARLGQTLNKDDGGYIVGLLEAVKPGATDAGAIAAAVVSAVGKDVAAEVVKAIGEKLGAA